MRGVKGLELVSFAQLLVLCDDSSESVLLSRSTSDLRVQDVRGPETEPLIKRLAHSASNRHVIQLYQFIRPYGLPRILCNVDSGAQGRQ